MYSETSLQQTQIYEGRSINKLQNDIILLIFKICKFRNIHFVGNLIGDIHWNFYDDDIIIVTPLVLRTQSVSAFLSLSLSFGVAHAPFACQR